MYPRWITDIEELTGLDCGYVGNGGIICPIFDGVKVPPPSESAVWLDREQVRQYYNPGFQTHPGFRNRASVEH